MKIIVTVIDGVYGRPADGVAVSVVCEPANEPGSRSTGLTDSRGSFTYSSIEEELPKGQQCTVKLDVDAYFTSLGFVAGYRQIAMVARIIDTDDEYRITTVITPFTHLTWNVR